VRRCAPLRIGSRASPLARAQAEWFCERVAGPTALVWIRSDGDRDRSTPLPELGTVGVFTAALHLALFEDRADCAVHSLKDLPVADEAGTLLACVPEREDPRDALVAPAGATLATLPSGARVGTGSPRRAAQLLRLRSDLVPVPIRGNVETRIRKARSGEVAAVVLALAGLRRLGRAEEATEVFEPDAMLPAAGQGALGVTVRADDAPAEAAVAPARSVVAAAATAAERSALHALGAGCHAPVGALARADAGTLTLRVRILSLDGRTALEEERSGPISDPRALGAAAAEALLGRGAGPLVAAR
jgi:hydroxymethylbilane synthase